MQTYIVQPIQYPTHSKFNSFLNKGIQAPNSLSSASFYSIPGITTTTFVYSWQLHLFYCVLIINFGFWPKKFFNFLGEQYEYDDCMNKRDKNLFTYTSHLFKEKFSSIHTKKKKKERIFNEYI